MERITMKQFIDLVEYDIIPLAKENTEGSYYRAKQWAKMLFSMTKLPVTERQIVNFVNRVWNKTNMEVAR